MNQMIKKIDGDFTVCKVTDYTKVNMDSRYCFIGKTEEEIRIAKEEYEALSNLSNIVGC